MPFPANLRVALAEGVDFEGILALDDECAGAKFHSPTPLVLHEVDVAGEAVLLCGTCRENLSVLQHLLTTHDGDVPWPVRREFGNLIRALALRGWESDAESGNRDLFDPVV